VLNENLKPALNEKKPARRPVYHDWYSSNRCQVEQEKDFQTCRFG
jgi:hypothetical protein